MLFQNLIFILELIFFVFTIIYVCFLWRERRDFSFREKTCLLFPAAVAVLLLMSGIKDSALSGGLVPATDILCSLLLMILIRFYVLSGHKFLSLLSYFLVLICVGFMIIRYFRVIPEISADAADMIVLYPMFIGGMMFLLIVFSIKKCFWLKSVKTANCPKPEDMFSYIFSVSSFFFILIVSVCIGVQSERTRVVFSVVPVLLASLLYYWQFCTYINELKRAVCSHPSASITPPPSLVVGDHNDKNDAVKELYCRILDLFDTSKPYLVDGMTVSEVARMLFTNKVYVSRAINDCTGKNFCQFINYYRVMYAVQLFNDNPYLKVSDLSDMSGFHNQVSFNMAFRLIMHETPSDWCRRQRLEREG